MIGLAILSFILAIMAESIASAALDTPELVPIPYFAAAMVARGALVVGGFLFGVGIYPVFAG